MKVRKKPVVVETMLFDGTLDAFQRIKLWIDNDVVQYHWTSPDHPVTMSIPTLEGTMIADKGDWIIKGVEGEFYPCKPDIFAKTYEYVD